MSQQPAKPVQTPLSRACAVIAVLLFVAAGFGWHTGWVQEHLRKPVLEKPIRFEEGFSLTASFSVPYTHLYWVEVVCPITTPSQRPLVQEVVSYGNPLRPLPIQFTIICNGIPVMPVVTEGDSTHSHPKEYRGSELFESCLMTGFNFEPGKRYDFSFHITGAKPLLDATKPIVRINAYGSDSDISEWIFSDTTPALFIAGLALLFALRPCWILICKRRQTSLTR